MNLDLYNFNFEKNNFVKKFIIDMQNFLENGSRRETNIQMESEFNEDKLITKFRDKFNIERNNLLNDYANKTIENGDMYYIYSKNFNIDGGFNLCMCREDASHVVVEVNKEELPDDAQIGSVLRMEDNKYIIDIDATEIIKNMLNTLKESILSEQAQYINSKRIEGHIYEMCDKSEDRISLFDNSSNEEIQEEFEEIDFPNDLLEQAQEGDLFKYENGEYKKI